jgi:hypothetical protein
MVGQAGHELGTLISSRLRVLSNIVVDALFLGLWLAVLALFDKVTAGLQNSGDLEWFTAKIILGVATLMLIILFLYWDLRLAYVQQRSRFEEERTKLDGAAPSVAGGENRDEHADQTG